MVCVARLQSCRPMCNCAAITSGTGCRLRLHLALVPQDAAASARTRSIAALIEQCVALEACNPEQVQQDLRQAERDAAAYQASFERVVKQSQTLKAELHQLNQQRRASKHHACGLGKLVAGAQQHPGAPLQCDSSHCSDEAATSLVHANGRTSICNLDFGQAYT